jgi:hypothetical protein
MASGSNGLAVAASSTSTSTEGVGAPAKAGSSGVESLPKEMQDMKIKDDKIDHSDDKELEATVVDGNGTETGHIIATTIGGRNGQPKQVCFHCMLCLIVSQLKETIWAKVNFE